ncbi:universal stress protein [Proteus mirabilis]|uniref:universal stress protein n=1 Tax=Proteus mirabilis TaxID=584 RepID=UPI00257704C2|nr:universal stress protein [Proteus mirabilis]MDM3706282.1 universal stress protein [Proteus mirabilis]MDM3721629.1 universal stress protein [Proteus mirabilis]
MYKTILVPVDISEDELTEKALQHAVYIAKLEGAKIHLFHAIPDVSRFSISYSYHYDMLSSFANKAIERVQEQLQELANSVDLPKEQVDFSAAFGSARDKVLELAEKIKADLIVVGSRRPSISTHLLGSNTSGIVAYAKQSVLVVR